uniref:Uncharacterized protein n=1 Tax=Moniliophthora roreri TaxID=221103 RepID=A0A0W0F8M5_MONRR
MLKCLSKAHQTLVKCLMLSNTPKWYFSNPKIEPYLKVIVHGWDTDCVGYRLKAFAIASCSPEKMSEKADKKSKILKHQIWDKVKEFLSEYIIWLMDNLLN